MAQSYKCRWRGDHAGKKQLWFPANYVEEMFGDEESGDNPPLGALQKGTIDLTGCTLGKVSRFCAYYPTSVVAARSFINFVCVDDDFFKTVNYRDQTKSEIF